MSVDGAVASLDALTEVVDAVGGALPVLFDGGVRRGADALAALALGAHLVLLGRYGRCSILLDAAKINIAKIDGDLLSFVKFRHISPSCYHPYGW